MTFLNRNKAPQPFGDSYGSTAEDELLEFVDRKLAIIATRKGVHHVTGDEAINTFLDLRIKLTNLRDIEDSLTYTTSDQDSPLQGSIRVVLPEIDASSTGFLPRPDGRY